MQRGETLQVRGHNGRVTYGSWAGDEVVIKVTKEARGLTRGLARWYARAVQVDMVRNADSLQVFTRPWGSWPRPNVAVHFDIRVPRGWSGQVGLETSNGTIRAEDLHGQATLRTSNGSISVRDHTGTLRVRSSNGRIDLVSVESVLQAETSNGAVSVDGVLQGSGYIRTSNGGVS